MSKISGDWVYNKIPVTEINGVSTPMLYYNDDEYTIHFTGTQDTFIRKSYTTQEEIEKIIDGSIDFRNVASGTRYVLSTGAYFEITWEASGNYKTYYIKLYNSSGTLLDHSYSGYISNSSTYRHRLSLAKFTQGTTTYGTYIIAELRSSSEARISYYTPDTDWQSALDVDIPPDDIVGTGGGATHVAKVTGLLSTLSSNLSDILAVAGGGGGGMVSSETAYTGANAGGISGSGSNSADQSTGYGFGQGESSGGGSGLYGGYKAANANGGGAGSGYIGNALLSNKKMVGYNVPTSSAESTKTESVNTYSANAEANKPKAGNGAVKITWLREIPPIPAPIIPDDYSNVVLELFHADGTYHIGGVTVYDNTYWSIFYCGSSSITVGSGGAVSGGSTHRGGATNKADEYDYEFHSESSGAFGFDDYSHVHELIYVNIKGTNDLSAFPTHYDSWEDYIATL